VAGVKHLHHASIDKAGKDTWRMAEAGARLVVAVGEGEVAVIKRMAGCKLREALKMIEGSVDVAVVEGFKGEAGLMESAVKVLTARSIKEVEELLGFVRPPIAAVTGPVAKQLRSWGAAPVVDLDENPLQLVGLVARCANIHLSSL
jgi:molybdopterin-guanine dinucleotide biosynthesis protein MobB